MVAAVGIGRCCATSSSGEGSVTGGVCFVGVLVSLDATCFVGVSVALDATAAMGLGGRAEPAISVRSMSA